MVYADLNIVCYILGRRTINRWNVSSFSQLLPQAASYHMWIFHWY